MLSTDTNLWWLVIAAGAVMALALLRGVGSCSVAMAQQLIDARREEEAKVHAANAAAEAAGRAAALEPLNLNSDGTIEDPIVGVVEKA